MDISLPLSIGLQGLESISKNVNAMLNLKSFLVEQVFK